MKKFIFSAVIAISLFLLLCGCSDAQVVGEPDEFHIELFQGESTQREITITNEGNATIIGRLYVLNVECGFQCPGARLTVSGSRQIELEPGESLDTTVHISSNLLNEPQEITLPIILDPGDYENWTTIAEIHITVHFNFIVYLGIPGIIVTLITIIIYTKRIKPKNIPPDLDSKRAGDE